MREELKGKEIDMKAISTKEIVKIINRSEEVKKELKWHYYRLENCHDEGQKQYIEEKMQILEDLREESDKAEKPLDDAIRQAEGKAWERTIDSWSVTYYLREIEEWLDLKKKDLEGVSVTVNENAREFPKAYKWMPEATIFSAEYKHGSWRITKIWRDDCRKYPRVTVTHTEQSKKAIVEKYSETMSLIKL